MFRSTLLTSFERSASFLKRTTARVGREPLQGKLHLEPLEDRTLLNASIVSVGTTMPAGSTLGVGQTVNIDVNFNQPVNVNTTNGTPLLTLNVIRQAGLTPTSACAVYTSGSGSSTLVFDYTVQSGDTTNG